MCLCHAPVTILSKWDTVAWKQLRTPGADLVAEYRNLESTKGSVAREGPLRQQPSRPKARGLSPYLRKFKKQVNPDPQALSFPEKLGLYFELHYCHWIPGGSEHGTLTAWDLRDTLHSLFLGHVLSPHSLPVLAQAWHLPPRFRISSWRVSVPSHNTGIEAAMSPQ